MDIELIWTAHVEEGIYATPIITRLTRYVCVSLCAYTFIDNTHTHTHNTHTPKLLVFVGVCVCVDKVFSRVCVCVCIAYVCCVCVCVCCISDHTKQLVIPSFYKDLHILDHDGHVLPGTSHTNTYAHTHTHSHHTHTHTRKPHTHTHTHTHTFTHISNTLHSHTYIHTFTLFTLKDILSLLMTHTSTPLPTCMT